MATISFFDMAANAILVSRDVPHVSASLVERRRAAETLARPPTFSCGEKAALQGLTTQRMS